VVDGQVPVGAPLVDFDLEVRPPAVPVPFLLPERSGEVGRVLLQRRLVQPKLGLFHLDDDGPIGMPKIGMSLCRARRARTPVRRPRVALVPLGSVFVFAIVRSPIIRRRRLALPARAGLTAATGATTAAAPSALRRCRFRSLATGLLMIFGGLIGPVSPLAAFF